MGAGVSLPLPARKIPRSPRPGLPAYATSWAYTFMLAERHPRELARYLKLVAAKPGFFPAVSGSERWHDFQTVFGNDLDMQTARLNRFVAELPR